MSTTKILVAYHKRSTLIKNEVFEPIHMGQLKETDKSWLESNMIGDDTNDNISNKNSTYNELTAIYWAYKNYNLLGNPDYIGLNHYRRFFIFNKNNCPYFEQKFIDDSFYKVINFDNYPTILNDCDFVAPMPTKRKSVYSNYVKAHNKDDIDLAIKIICEQYPNIGNSAIKYAKSNGAYYYNMFIFDKATFFDYCDFIFSILNEYEKLTIHNNERLFISEFLTGVFFEYLISIGKRPLFLPVLFIGGKQSFKDAILETKNNFKKNSSLIYKIKPILIFFIPNKLLLARKQKSSIKVS